MVKIYAVVLVVGLIALLAWILAHVLSNDARRELLDPEVRFGIVGRRVVAGMIGFSMAGLSAEFSPRNLSWPVALALAAIGAAALAWYAGRPSLIGPQSVPDRGSHSTDVSD